MKKALIYSRVSTDEQAKEGQSIEAQIKLCRAYAKDNQITVVDVFKDEGKSGSNTNRPALQAMLTKVAEDKTIDHVLVLDTDRIARNTLDHLSIKSLLAKHHVSLISISQPMIDDSPEGNFIDVVLAGANALQSQITGRKTSKVMEQKAKAGWWPSWAPLGYENTQNPTPTSTLDKRILTPHPSNGPLITQLFQFYSKGTYSVESLTKKMVSLGLKNRQGGPIAPSIVNLALRNPIYYGDFVWREKLYHGNHIPLTTKPIWDLCQDIMDKHNQYAERSRKHQYLLRGFLYCDKCGSRFWAAPHKGRNGIHHYYYCKKCTKGTYSFVKDLDKESLKLMGKVQITDQYAQELTETIQNSLKELRSQTGQEKQALVNQRTALEQKQHSAEDNLLDGTLSKDQFSRINQRIESEIATIEQQVYELSDNYQTKMEQIIELVNLARNIQETYKEVDFEMKRYYLGLFFDKIYVDDGKIVSATPSKAIAPLIKNGKILVRVRTNWLPG